MYLALDLSLILRALSFIDYLGGTPIFRRVEEAYLHVFSAKAEGHKI